MNTCIDIFFILWLLSICLGMAIGELSNNLIMLKIGLGIVIAGVISLAVAFILSIIISSRPNYIHTVTARYEVVCDDNGNFNVSSDIELPKSAVQANQ